MIINGTTYHDDTSPAVVGHLEKLRLDGKRFSLSYGDTKTGRDWLEEHDIAGTVGRSTGPVKIPLMLANSLSIGGAGILDHCIVRLRVGKRVIYSHPHYHHGVVAVGFHAGTGRPYTLSVNGKAHAAFTTEKQRARYISRLGLTVSETVPA